VYEQDKFNVTSVPKDEHERNDNTQACETNEKIKEEEPSDDLWALMRLTKWKFVDGALDDPVLRHPFPRYSALSYV
jgi:hypothetical protein